MAVQGQYGFIQFVTSYIDSIGIKHIRVTTCSRQWNVGGYNNVPGLNVLTSGFDEDASAVLMARISAYRCINDDNPKDVLRWIDRTLIKLCQFSSEYAKGNPSSFKLPQNMILYPQYMYHLRRSQFLQCFNNSPDETTFYRYYLLKEDVTNCCVMIQPVLYSYRMDTPQFAPQPVLLDTDSIQNDNILFLDTYFHVLIHLGRAIDDWKKQNYHLDPNYESFARFIEIPEKDALYVVSQRFPIPRYIYTSHGASQARFLLSKVNPRTTQNNSTIDNSYYSNDYNSNVTVFTDDISLDMFMEHIKKLVTSES